MFGQILKIVSLALLVAVGAVGIVVYRDHYAAGRTISRLEEEKAQLNRIVERLGAERRVADVLVTDQKTVDGVTVTELLWVEYARDGKTALSPKRFTIRGDEAHIDALVIKFDNDLVNANDPLRGHSIALFTRIYGDRQTPADASVIDPPGVIPLIYRDADPNISDFERSLWKDFWRLTDDPAYRQSKHVRIANGQGVFQQVRPDRLYTLTIETNGGVNITSRPIEPIYLEALKRQSAS